MIHGTVNSSDGCKVLGRFGTKYAAAQPTKNRGRYPIPRKRFHKEQENYTIINNLVYELRMIESKKIFKKN